MTLTISFPADTEARLRDTAAATGKDVPTLVREAVEEKLSGEPSDAPGLPQEFIRAIEESNDLPTLRDEDDQLMVARATWERAIDFLKTFARGAGSIHGARIDVPAILPGPQGSIDLHWKFPQYEMLVNISADQTILPNYYGDDRDGNSVKGTVVSGDNRGLLLWLTTRT